MFTAAFESAIATNRRGLYQLPLHELARYLQKNERRKITDVCERDAVLEWVPKGLTCTGEGEQGEEAPGCHYYEYDVYAKGVG